MRRAVLVKEPKATTAYVCIDEPFGGMKVAIYHVDYCLKVGDRAFIARSTPFRKLLVVPASSVFETKKEAEVYAAQQGTLRWCVVETAGDIGDEVEVFEAYVRENFREKPYYGAGFRVRRLAVRKGAKETEPFWRLNHFATKKEADQAARRIVRDKLKEAEQTMHTASRVVGHYRRLALRLERGES